MAVTDEMVCFSLYSAARATTQAYRTLLAPWGLTYPQYLVLVLLWNEGDQTIGSLGDAMQLDSGTLSPLVRRLERDGLVVRARSTDDERVVTVRLTDRGHELRAELVHIPQEIGRLLGIRGDAHRLRVIEQLRELHALLPEAEQRPEH
jgi:DNA-binding MarR family transcriptional regulator